MFWGPTQILWMLEYPWELRAALGENPCVFFSFMISFNLKRLILAETDDTVFLFSASYLQGIKLKNSFLFCVYGGLPRMFFVPSTVTGSSALCQSLGRGQTLFSPPVKTDMTQFILSFTTWSQSRPIVFMRKRAKQRTACPATKEGNLLVSELLFRAVT